MRSRPSGGRAREVGPDARGRSGITGQESPGGQARYGEKSLDVAMALESPVSLELLSSLSTTALGTVCKGKLTRSANSHELLLWVPDPLLGARSDRIDEIIACCARCARLEHPNVLPIRGLLRAVEPSDRSFAWIEGDQLLPLSFLLCDEDPLPLSISLSIAQAVALALDACLRQPPRGALEGFRQVHRDIRPSTIFLGTGGEIQVFGFGLAPWSPDPKDPINLLFQERGADSLAPEQREGAPPDPSMDIYALGATMLEIFTKRPLGAAAPRAIRHRILVEERLAGLVLGASSAEIEREIRALVAEMLTFQPENRPTAQEVARWIGDILRPMLEQDRVSIETFAQERVGPLLHDKTPAPPPRDPGGPTWLRPLDPELERLSAAFLPSQGADLLVLPLTGPAEDPLTSGPTARLQGPAPLASPPNRARLTRLLVLGVAAILCLLLILDTFFGFLPLSFLRESEGEFEVSVEEVKE